MKITKLTTYIVPPRWCFLKIETDAGIVGWGEPVVEGRAHSVAAAVEELSDYLIGKDPRNIEDHWTVPVSYTHLSVTQTRFCPSTTPRVPNR